jgi:uncharacterized protein YbaP (TraB family)
MAEHSLFAEYPAEREYQALPLWEVKGQTPDSGKIWLLGSVHLRKEGKYDVDARIDECFKKADALVVEVDPLTQPENSTLLMGKYGFYLDGSTIGDHVSPKLYRELPGVFESVGVPFGNEFNKARPWLLALTLTVTKMQRCGYESMAGIDHIFLSRSRTLGKEIIPLETLEYQFRLFSDLSEETQVAVLEDAVDSIEEICEKTEAVTDAWERGDLDTIERLILDEITSKHALKPFFDKIIQKRNLQMMEKIEKLARKGKNYLVVVGAAHLLGKEGIVRMLEERGYSVRRLNRSGEKVVIRDSRSGNDRAISEVSTFRSDSFSIRMPGNPASQELKGRDGTPIGFMYMKQITQNTFYMVTSVHLPGEIPDEQVPVVFEEALKKLTGFVSNPEIVRKELDRVDGKSIFRAEIVSKHGRIHCKFILFGADFYQLTVNQGVDSTILPLSPDDYFKSFKITAPAGH